jgi:DMSO/TMAO reductase YedYZ heme-binding membrane subunit
MQKKQLTSRRIITHIFLGALPVLLVVLLMILFPRAKQYGVLVIASGYLSLVLICVTLLIGPFNLLRQRRNPVNLYLRRDVGIWSALTGCWHVALIARGNIVNGQILQYFWQGSAPLWSIFGISNDAGLFATLLLILLLALSNTVSLRWLKGKRWKLLQRLAYPLAFFAVLHTFGFQYLNLRGPVLFTFVFIMVLCVLVLQGSGIALLLFRRRKRAE